MTAQQAYVWLVARGRYDDADYLFNVATTSPERSTMSKPKPLRSWDGPKPMTSRRQAQIKASVFSRSESDAATLVAHRVELLDEVERLQYELTLAHGLIPKGKPKPKGKKKKK